MLPSEPSVSSLAQWNEWLQFIARVISPPLLVIILVFTFVGAYGFRNRGWYLLFAGWLVNLTYLYIETYTGYVTISGVKLSQPMATSISVFSSVLFGLYGFQMLLPRFYSRLVLVFPLLGLAYVIFTAYVVKQTTGGLFSDIEVSSHAWLMINVPGITLSTVTTIVAAVGLSGYFRSQRFRRAGLVTIPWLVYGIIQPAYLVMTVGDKLWITLAFAAAALCKISIATGLVDYYRFQTELAERRRIYVWQIEAFSAFAHELKHPVFNISNRTKALSRLLAENKLGELERNISALSSDATIARRIVNDVVIAAEPVNKKLVEYVLINDILDKAIELVKVSPFLDIVFKVRRDYAKTLVVCAQPVSLIQIFTNLIRNAIEACVQYNESLPTELRESSGLTHARIFIKTEKGTLEGIEHVVASVSDLGIGISRGDQAHIFDPYVSKKKGVNRGLGLWVVRSYVSMFGGKVDVESPPRNWKRGTRFSVSLPSAENARKKGLAPEEFFQKHTQIVGENTHG